MKITTNLPVWWAKFVENYRFFTGNIGKGCMRSLEVNNKITPWPQKACKEHQRPH